MSFRLFIYYCALIGAWTGMAGWALGRFITEKFVAADNTLLQDGLRGLFLGVLVALGLGTVDAVWNLGWRQYGQVLARLGVAVVVGAMGGLLGGMLAQWLIQLTNHVVSFFVLGWTLAGLIMGAAVAGLEWLLSKIRSQDQEKARAKFLKCMTGGAVGGLIGALVAYFLRDGWSRMFSGKEPSQLWSPTAIGFVTLGLFIGLLVGLAQVFLKVAWVKVEAGFRSGRELILSKDTTVIGRAEGSDIALFGDTGVDKTHAQIVHEGTRYVLQDVGSATGTFVNDKKVTGRVALRSGDLIRVGKSVLRFNEKTKR